LSIYLLEDVIDFVCFLVDIFVKGGELGLEIFWGRNEFVYYTVFTKF